MRKKAAALALAGVMTMGLVLTGCGSSGGGGNSRGCSGGGGGFRI